MKSKDAEILDKCQSETRTDVRKWLIDRLASPVVTRFNTLYLTTKDFLEFKKHYCAGCGNPKRNPRIVYGEEFCQECADKMEPGYRALKTISAWKMDIRKIFGKK